MSRMAKKSPVFGHRRFESYRPNRYASVAQWIPFRQSLIARHSSNKFGSALTQGDLERHATNVRVAGSTPAGSTIYVSVAQRIPFRQSLVARHSSNKFGSAFAHCDLGHPTSNRRAASWVRPFSLFLGIAQASLALHSELRRVLPDVQTG